MLDTHQFIENINEIQNKIYNSFMLKEIDRKNLSPTEAADLKLKVFEIATNTALQLQQVMQKEKELEFSLYKQKAELEINVILAKANATKALGEAFITTTQGYVAKRSVIDNANIQRANLYTQLIQIIANASNLNAISQTDKNGNSHISNCIAIISKIKDTEDPTLDKLLNQCIIDLVNRNGEIMLLGAGSQDVFIFATKKEIQTNEMLEIYGIHIFSNNECEFILDDKSVIKGKSFIFQKDKQGVYEITFRVKNINDEWISTSAHIIVKDIKIDRELPLIQLDSMS